MLAYLLAAELLMAISRCTLVGLQPPQNPMLSGVFFFPSARSGSQPTPDSPETMSTR